MPDITDLSQYLSQAGIDSSQGGGNTTTLPQMPEQSVQANPVAPIQATPVTSPDDFESQLKPLLEQLNGGTEAIEKKKREEYFRNLGIKPGKENTFINRLNRGLKEGGLMNDARMQKVPYKPMNERMQDAAQAEYEKTYPVLKTEITELRKSKTAKEANDRILEKTRLDNASREANVRAQEATKAEKTKFYGLRQMAAADKDRFGGFREQALTDKIKQETKNAEEQNPNDPAPIRMLKAVQKIAEDTDEPIPDILQRMKDISAATSKPDMSPLGQALRDPTGKVVKTYKELHPTVLPNLIFKDTTNVNKDTGETENGMIALNPKTGQPSGQVNLGAGVTPKNVKKQQTNDDYSQTISNGKILLGDISNAIRSGDDFTGPASGNSVVASMRAMGIIDPKEDVSGKSTKEAIYDGFKNNVAFKHTRGLMGGGRITAQLKNDTDQSLGHKWDDINSIYRGAANILYSGQLGLLNNSGIVKGQDITPEHARQMAQEIERGLRSAKNKAGGPVQLPKDFIDIHKGIQASRAATTPQTSKQKMDNIRKAVGLSTSQ